MITREYKAPSADVTFDMIPFRSARLDMLISTLDRRIPKDEQYPYHNVYLMIEGCTAQIRFGDDLPIEWQGLQSYWQSRTRDAVANYDLFWNCITSEIMWQWWQAYEATRDISIAAPPEVSTEAGESADPNSESNGSKPLQTSKSDGKKLPSLAQQMGLTA